MPKHITCVGFVSASQLIFPHYTLKCRCTVSRLCTIFARLSITLSSNTAGPRLASIMAEALGLAASIAGLASLVIQLTQISVDYASKVSSASKTQAAYIQELIALQSVLEKFKNAAAVDGLEAIIGHRDSCISTPAVESYKRQIEKVKAKLEKNLTRTGPFSG